PAISLRSLHDALPIYISGTSSPVHPAPPVARADVERLRLGRLSINSVAGGTRAGRFADRDVRRRLPVPLPQRRGWPRAGRSGRLDRKRTRLNSSHGSI